jgi:glycosyltransferase involved in cell wall biosynthesis
LAVFREAKRIGALCVLDAASVHFAFQRQKKNPADESFQRQVDSWKAEEILLADKIVVLSTFAKQTYIEGGVLPEKLVIIAPGADLSMFVQKPPRVSESGFHYLFAGNLTRDKGIDLLISAFAKINVPGKTLTLIGKKQGGLPDTIKRLPNVKWVGYLSPESVRDEFHRADILVLPSRLDGFGLVVAEAMATGTPVIVSSAVGAKDLVRTGENGWVFESENVSALAEAMELSYQNRQRLVAMGVRARDTVAGDYTWEAYRERIRAFYLNMSKSSVVKDACD